MDKILYITTILILGLMVYATGEAAPQPTPPVVLRDPTQPPEYLAKKYQPPSTGDINIEAVIVGKNRKIAIIGGHRFRIGDKLAGATIVAIDDGGITLQDNDDAKVKTRIELLNSTIKSPNMTVKYKTL